MLNNNQSDQIYINKFREYDIKNATELTERIHEGRSMQINALLKGTNNVFLIA